MIGIKTTDEFWEIIEELNTIMPANEIVQAMVNHEVSRDKIDYLDLVKENDDVVISYLPAKRAQVIRENEGTENIYNATGRQKARVGKALNKILLYEVPSDDLKEFVEHVHTLFLQNTYEFKIVPSREFPKYYLTDNYTYAPNSELGKSCMRYEKCQSWLKIYQDNPNLEMAVVTKRGKVAARALIWKKVKLAQKADVLAGHWRDVDNSKLISPPKQEDIIVLDRIYSANPTAKQIIADWGKNNCDLIHQTPKDAHHFKWAQTGEVNYNLALYQEYSNYKYEHYPYIDTFRYFDLENNRLVNQRAMVQGRGILFNDAAEGRFSAVTDNSPRYPDIQYELNPIVPLTTTLSVTFTEDEVMATYRERLQAVTNRRPTRY
jgi:hypothetical protein